MVKLKIDLFDPKWSSRLSEKQLMKLIVRQQLQYVKRPLFRPNLGGIALPISRPKICNTDNMTDEQAAVMKLALRKQSIFFTGSAGTGKTWLLSKLIEMLKFNLPIGSVAVTASTGLAACHVGGSTLHSFAGAQLASGSLDQALESVWSNSKAVDRWKSISTLIIDEISMVDGPFFEKLDYIAKNIRGNSKPFGGIQLIMCGDFLQLPPVGDNVNFAFESSAWQHLDPKCIVLSQIFRQNDQKLIKILTDMRFGIVTDESERILKGLENRLINSSILPTTLYPLREDAARHNQSAIDSLAGSPHSLEAKDEAADYFDISKLDYLTLSPKLLKLKVGAQVVLTKNYSSTLFNGSSGIVTGLADDHVSVRFLKTGSISSLRSKDTKIKRVAHEIIGPDGNLIASRGQFPILPSYALTIHKSQGQTLPLVRVDLKNVFEFGQTYVALSRVRSLESLEVLNFNKSAVKVNPLVANFYKSLIKV